MEKKFWKWAAIGSIGVVAAGAGITAGVLLSHHEDHPTSLTPEENIKKIYDSIYHLTGDEDSTYESFDDFHKQIMDKIENDDVSLEGSIIDTLDLRLNSVYDEMEKNLDITNAGDKMIMQLLDKYKLDMSEVMEEMKSGFVGVHDFNFYKNILEGKADLSRVIAAKEELDSKIVENKKEVQDVKIEVQQTNDAITGLENELTQTQTLITTVETDFQNQLNSLSTTTNDEITMLKNQYHVDKEAVKTNINQLKSDFATEIAALKSAAGDIQTAISSNTSSIEDLNSKVMILNAKTVNILKSLALLFKNVQVIQNEIQKFKSDTDAGFLKINNEITHIKTNFDTLKTKISSFDAKFNNLENKIYDLDASLAVVNEKIDNIEIVVNNINEKVNINKTQIANIKNELNTISLKWDSLKSAVDANKNKIGQLVVKIFSIEQNIARIFSTLDTITAQLDQNTAKIYNLEERVIKLEKLKQQSGSTILYQADEISSAISSNIWFELPSLVKFSQLIVTFQKARYGDEFISEIIPVHTDLFHEGSEVFVFNVFKERDKSMPIYLQIRKTQTNTYEIRVVNDVSDPIHGNRYSNKFISIAGIH